MSIAENLIQIRRNIPEHVQLVCVSKFHPDASVMEAYQAGERVFGESKVQEMTGKFERLPKDIHWHFIGHLQTNKVKYIIPFVELIHGVDSFRLLSEINKQALKINKKVNCLLQFHIADEETKFGFTLDEVKEMFMHDLPDKWNGIEFCGVMGMATFTSDKQQVSDEFKSLKNIFDYLKQNYFSGINHFRIISMGMSDDFELAIQEGSNMVRIGSSIFGNRIYNQ